MGRLYDKLTEYEKSDFYAYHMPGHKRNMTGRPFEEFYGLDITEIDGFDNLHQPEEILFEVEKRANRMYGADETFLLVNGSTCGILSAISATTRHGGKILIARNCHKSVYHAAYLRNLEIQYVYPESSEQFGIAFGLEPGKVEEKLAKDSGISAVVVTSPTYEGVISDIEGIAKIVHQYGIPLIVDEAHGAHLGFSKGFHENAVRAGADLVIHSLHKTLPSPTQTALLHVTGNRVDRERLKRFLGIYQSSSPSYPLMAGIELCLDIVEKEGKELFARMLYDWNEMQKRLCGCKALKILHEEDVLSAGMKAFDVGKLVISTVGTNWSGKKLYEELLQKYHLQLEMAADTYVLAMFTLMDTEEGFKRLTEALLELDKRIPEEKLSRIENGHIKSGKEISEQTVTGTFRLKTGCRIAEALDAEKEWLPVSICEGRTAAGFINLYPPGIPAVVPGEVYSEEAISNIKNWCKKKLSVQGINSEMEVPVIAEREENMKNA